jgi:hypothetical protein
MLIPTHIITFLLVRDHLYQLVADMRCSTELSVVAYDPKYVKIVGEFDEYIKPTANAVWSNHASEVHGIFSTDVRIASAMRIPEV